MLIRVRGNKKNVRDCSRSGFGDMRKMLLGTFQAFNVHTYELVDCFANIFQILQYLPFPSSVVALWGIGNQGFDFFEVGSLLLKIYLWHGFQDYFYSKSTFDTNFSYGNAMGMLYRFQGPPALCGWW